MIIIEISSNDTKFQRPASAQGIQNLEILVLGLHSRPVVSETGRGPVIYFN